MPDRTEQENRLYRDYVKKKTPLHSLPKNMARAFVTGGVICTLGEAVIQLLEKAGVDQKETAAWCPVILIFVSVVLTGLNVYGKIARWGGAGALVPVTGFANSVAAPAIEYKKEGQVMGIGCKIFTIAGPVLLYGILVSSLLGLIWWAALVLGVAG